MVSWEEPYVEVDEDEERMNDAVRRPLPPVLDLNENGTLTSPASSESLHDIDDYAAWRDYEAPEER